MEQKSFADIFEDVTKQAVKIQKKDYLPTGRYPIIDQGQEWCAGYTDREDALFQDVPAYIFGDHTRIIKYTDEPFYLGADGVKLLKLREGIQANPRFFYYALKSQRIPDTGYNRHFKWLKESLYHVPTLNEQTHIADTLDTLSTLITLCKTKIFLFDELVKSRFIEMFGDPVTNPMGWEVKRLKDICAVGSSKRIYQREQTSTGVPFLRISDLVTRITSQEETFDLYISEKKFNEFEQQALVPKTGDILVTARGTLGLCYIIKPEDRFYFQDGMISWVHASEADINSVYISYLFGSQGIKRQIDRIVAGSTVSYLSIAQLGQLDILLPSLALQNEFAAFAQQADKSKLVLHQLLEKQQTLKAALIQEYFAVH
mgnify:CR=1 FL=1